VCACGLCGMLPGMACASVCLKVLGRLQRTPGCGEADRCRG
jgi:hypothetical protein